MDACFKYDRFLTDLSQSYLSISLIETLTYLIMIIFFNKSVWFVVLHSAHPIRGFVGFYLYFIIPKGNELLDRIDYTKFKDEGGTQRPDFKSIPPIIEEDVHLMVLENIDDFSKGALYHGILSGAALIMDTISFLVFLV